jgi:phospholipase B1
MAGFAMMGVTKKEETPGVIEFDFDFVREFRGNSYGIGGDTGAVTLANFIKHYNSNVSGPSTSSHLVSLCYGPFCVPYLSRCELTLKSDNNKSGLTSIIRSTSQG